MDQWISRRRNDVRFSNELRRVDMSNTHWYNAGQRVTVLHERFSASAGTKSDSKPEPTIKKKKKRMKKTESGNEKSATSDGSDGGPCWVSARHSSQMCLTLSWLRRFCYLLTLTCFCVRRAITSGFRAQSRVKRVRAVPREARKSRARVQNVLSSFPRRDSNPRFLD